MGLRVKNLGFQLYCSKWSFSATYPLNPVKHQGGSIVTMAVLSVRFGGSGVVHRSCRCDCDSDDNDTCCDSYSVCCTHKDLGLWDQSIGKEGSAFRTDRPQVRYALIAKG